jgi:hypothetical protein
MISTRSTTHGCVSVCPSPIVTSICVGVRAWEPGRFCFMFVFFRVVFIIYKRPTGSQKENHKLRRMEQNLLNVNVFDYELLKLGKYLKTT